MASRNGLYHEFMAPLKLSQIIDSIDDSKLNLELGCKEENESNVVTRLLDSLHDPLNFPALEQAILDEDTVCIALDPATPAGLLIAAQLAKRVSAIGMPLDQITILLAESANAAVVQQLKSELDRIGCSGCQVAVHDSGKREDIAFLGPAESGDPILLNAKLVHADFVLPVASFEPSGWKSQIDFLYPYFSDVDSQKRFFELKEANRISFNQEVSRWLGAIFLVAAIGQGTTRVVSGEQASVKKRIDEMLRAGAEGLNDVEEVNNGNASGRSDDGEISSDGQTRLYPMVVGLLSSRLCLSVEEITAAIEPLSRRCSATGTILLVWDDEVEVPRFVDREKNEPAHFADDYGQDGQQKLYFSTSQSLLAELGVPSVSSVSELKKLVGHHDCVLVLADSDRKSVFECLNPSDVNAT